MAHKPECLVCKKEMEIGFLINGYTLHLPKWCAGKPEGRFGRPKRQQIADRTAVTAYRCPECHALRLYAFDS